ncbi:MAG: hypothetical protein J1F35_07020 [Erysipelotrichales bacterium]|nr:hypothetical protein [Erysipelotrichales bacterium]
MVFPMIGSWFFNTMTDLFIGLLDTVCYGLLTVAYNIFYAVAQIDLFGGGTAGQTLYTEITKRLYMIISIIMVFVFAYQLIMLVIDPDGKGKGASSQVVKDTLFSIILLIVMPLIFRYMAMFQFHVLENNTIPAIILGNNGQDSENDNPGKNVAIMVLISFFHPNGTTYNTFFDENGDIRGDAVELCNQETEEEDGKSHDKTCNLYVESLADIKGKAGVKALTWNEKKLRHWVGDTMTYTWVISSVAALAVAWVFFLYAIDIGVRAVKLGVLQLISPIPVILRIFPNTKKSYEAWINQMKKTYLELFIRIAIIFFALEIVKLIPVFIGIIFSSQNSSVAGPFTKCVATVILILGILKFGQDAPALFKELFSVGGNLLSGVKLNPLPNHAKDRLTENKALMWSAGKANAMVGAWKSEFHRQNQANRHAQLDATNDPHAIRSGLKAMPFALRGVVAAAKQKKTALTDVSLDAIRQAQITGANAANKNFNDNDKLKEYSENTVEYLKNKALIGKSGSSLPERAKNQALNTLSYVGSNVGSFKDDVVGNIKDASKERKDFKNIIYTDSAANNQTDESLTSIINVLKNLKDTTKDKTKDLTTQIEDLQKIVNTSTVRTDPGTFNVQRPKIGNYANKDAYDRAMESYNKQFEEFQKNKEAFNKYDQAKKLIDQAKSQRNDKVASVLMGTPAGQQYTINALNKALEQMQKSPMDLIDKNGVDMKDTIQSLLTKASHKDANGNLDPQLSGADIKAMNDIITQLTDTRTMTSALKQQQQDSASSFSSQSSSGGSGDSGSSSGDKAK